MKALVTGDAGFVGRNYVRFLKDEGWDVYGMDIATDPRDDAFKFFAEDSEEFFDLIVHCAYEVGGRAHIDGSNMALAKNVAMDASMFQWALNGGASSVLYFSSSAAYPIAYQHKLFVEGAPVEDRLLEEDFINYDSVLTPDANYGWAKLTGERVAKAASEQGLRVHVVRPFSGYGGDQDSCYPFPAILERAKHGDLSVWGPEGQTRDFIHIDDVVRGSYQIYLNDERRAVNLSTGVGTTMGQLAQLAYSIYHDTNNVPDVSYDEDKPTGVFYRVGDPELFNQHYVPQISIEEGVVRAYGRT